MTSGAWSSKGSSAGGGPDYLDEGRIVRDAPHEPQRGGAGEYRRDEALGTCVRIRIQAEMYRLTEIGGFCGHNHAILWDGGIYDPLRPSPISCHVRRAVYAQFQVLEWFRWVDGDEPWLSDNCCPPTFPEGFLPNPDLVVFPSARALAPTAEDLLVISVEDPEFPGNKAFRFASTPVPGSGSPGLSRQR